MTGINAFGKLPSGKRLKRIEASPNYRNGQFQNIEPTAVIPKDVPFLRILKDMLNQPKSVKPTGKIPSVKTDLASVNSDNPIIIWFGHSSYLIASKGINILVDPVLSGNASPVKFFGKAFPGADVYKAEDMPPIDILIITHDHYDHLDMDTILKIHHKVRKIITPLGVGSHLEYWGVESGKITELDWWDKQVITSEMEITATPARHFSGRGIARAKTLWASFVLQINGYKIFIGSDSGYDRQFKIIGEKFGGFDLALLECGQYGRNWPHIHMMPEQTVQAAGELGADVLLPVHWAKFTLANHPWNEPPKRALAGTLKENQKIVLPMIGEPYTIGEAFKQTVWWEIE